MGKRAEDRAQGGPGQAQGGGKGGPNMGGTWDAQGRGQREGGPGRGPGGVGPRYQ